MNWKCLCFLQSAVGSGQTGSDEGETERSQVPHRGGVLETADIFCQWFDEKLLI